MIAMIYLYGDNTNCLKSFTVWRLKTSYLSKYK